MIFAAPSAHAEMVRIGLNGARPSELPIISQLLESQGLTQSGWLDFASHVGENWLPGMAVTPIDYPAQLGALWGGGALSGDQSITVGQQLLHDAIMASLQDGNTVAVAGVSMGTLVIDKELAYLAENPDLVDPANITFYLFGGEARGFGEMYARGVTVPILGVTFEPVAETPYHTVVVYAQWDGWANPPDRPWHLLSVVNAVMGVLLTINGSNDHSKAALENIDNAVLVSDVTNSLGGRTETYMIPGEDLPLTRPLRQLGVPGWLVDQLDNLLMPFIAAGYSTMTPQLGPHFEKGQLVWTSPATTTAVTADSATVADVEPDQSQRSGASVDEGDDAENVITALAAESEPDGDEAAESDETPTDTTALDEEVGADEEATADPEESGDAEDAADPEGTTESGDTEGSDDADPADVDEQPSDEDEDGGYEDGGYEDGADEDGADVSPADDTGADEHDDAGTPDAPTTESATTAHTDTDNDTTGTDHDTAAAA